MELTQQVKNYYASVEQTSTRKSPFKEQDKPVGAHAKALQQLANGKPIEYDSTLRVVGLEGSRSPNLPARQTQKHPGYIRNESGGYFTS